MPAPGRQDLLDLLEHHVKSKDKWAMKFCILEKVMSATGIDVHWLFQENDKQVLYDLLCLDDEALLNHIFDKEVSR